MGKITKFVIEKLHGNKNIELEIEDNTLILVGENGAGKSTILQLFYYFLSGQWTVMTKYDFESISITINNKDYSLRFSELEKSFNSYSHRMLRRVPPSVRHKVIEQLEKLRLNGDSISPQLERISEIYDIPLHILIDELSFFDPSDDKTNDALKDFKQQIRDSLKSQFLYLPTYRRIEQELGF